MTTITSAKGIQLLCLPQDIQAINAGRAQVGDDKIERILLRLSYRLLTAEAALVLVPRLKEGAFKDPAHKHLIIHHQDSN